MAVNVFDEEYLKIESERFHRINPKDLDNDGCIALFEEILLGLADKQKNPVPSKYVIPLKPVIRMKMIDIDQSIPIRERMVLWRESNSIELETMSYITGVSSGLLGLIEGGYVTHPEIAKKIQKGYHLSDEDVLELFPPNHREGSPAYDPNKFKDLRDLRAPGVVLKKRRKKEKKEHEDSI